MLSLYFESLRKNGGCAKNNTAPGAHAASTEQSDLRYVLQQNSLHLNTAYSAD